MLSALGKRLIRKKWICVSWNCLGVLDYEFFTRWDFVIYCVENRVECTQNTSMLIPHFLKLTDIKLSSALVVFKVLNATFKSDFNH